MYYLQSNEIKGGAAVMSEGGWPGTYQNACSSMHSLSRRN